MPIPYVFPGSPACFNRVGGGQHVLAVHQPQSARAVQEKPPVLVDKSAVNSAARRLPVVALHLAVRQDAPDKWRRLQFDEHALRAVLEEPAPALIRLIVALHKALQPFVQQPRPFGAGRAAGKCPTRLCARIAHPPRAARIQRQPAKTMRHIGPAPHGLFHDFIHSAADYGCAHPAM